MAQANQTMHPELPSIPASGLHETSADGVDPELLELPAPPRGRRLIALTVMALVVTAALALVATLRADVSYFFAPTVATDIGTAVTLRPSELSGNTFVRIEGTPMASGTVRYSRLLGGTEYAVFPLAGQRDLFVQVALDRGDPRTDSRREFSGRLVTFGELGGRFGAVRRHLEGQMGMPVSGESFLLLADESPGNYAWAVGLSGLAILFILLDLLLILRWFRPIPATEAEGSEEPELARR
ncbi:MAG: hypothetical protein OEY14_11175, partial [Myxococcales bacterium]|nr:hypothetical protein [Myxococcales bacterium]